MNKLLHLLEEQTLTLLVSLPRNDAELATAALRGGAQGLKIHLNVQHFAAGTHFGSFAAERDNIARILEVAGEVPVGVVPGGAPFATPAEFDELARLGVDFFDAYPADTPPWALAQQSLSRMLAAYEGATIAMMGALEFLGMEMCEASIVNHAAYGCALDLLDLARYTELAQALSVPVLVPSQKRITPDDIPHLRRTGVAGLLIGAIVTGHEVAGLESATRALREACS